MGAHAVTRNIAANGHAVNRPEDAGSRWQPSGTMRRRASIGVGLVLLVVCGAAITESQHLGNQVAAVSQTSNLATLFQDARFFGSVADTELLSYELTRDDAAWAAHQSEAAALDETLQKIAAIDPVDSTQVAQMLAASQQFQQFGLHVAQLVANHDSVGAAELQATAIDPLVYRVGTVLADLENSHERQASNELRAARRNVAVLRFGTPIALALVLLLLAGLSSVTRAHRRALQRQAHHDALTGLPNRPLFLDRATQALAAASRGVVEPVVMMLDLDRFKEVNDTFGHRQGDQLLIQVGARLASSLRPGDTVARLGGDEFAILLPDGGQQAAAEVAARIVSSLERPFDLEGLVVSIEASIGIALTDTEVDDADCRPDADPATDLLQRADTAMYRAKKQRSGYVH
jgi:diguanylate cyclase (GGDEF)-like protein